MEWLIAGLLIGFGIGQMRRREVDLDLAANRFRTRCNVGARIAEESKILMSMLVAQAHIGFIDLRLLAKMMDSVADLNYLASDLVEDHAALLQEVSNGGTKAHD